MVSSIAPRQPAVASEQEGPAIGRLARVLEALSDDDPRAVARLQSPSGETLDVPETLLALLRLAVQHLDRGDGVALTPLPKEVSRLEAAGLLDLIPTELDELIERGQISSTREESEAPSIRIALQDVLSYRASLSARRQAAIDELTRLSQELGLYDLDEMPPD